MYLRRLVYSRSYLPPLLFLGIRFGMLRLLRVRTYRQEKEGKGGKRREKEKGWPPPFGIWISDQSRISDTSTRNEKIDPAARRSSGGGGGGTLSLSLFPRRPRRYRRSRRYHPAGAGSVAVYTRGEEAEGGPLPDSRFQIDPYHAVRTNERLNG